MRSYLFISFFIIFLLLTPPIFAHPGRTASDGCHYCRTNCDSWGVPWNERHCHNGSSAPIQQAQPTQIPIEINTPTSTVTPYPTSTPILTNTPIPTNTPTPVVDSQNITQEVAGTSTSSNNSFGSAILGLLLLTGLIGGIYFKNKRNKSKSSPENL